MAPYLYTILAKITICFVCFQPPNDYDILGGDFEDDVSKSQIPHAIIHVIFEYYILHFF